MNRIVIQTEMFPETKIYGKYHLVTYCEDNGEDDKDYVNDMITACAKARQYLNGDCLTEPYEKVYLFNEIENTLIKVFDKDHKNGRPPYQFEIANFNVKS